MRKGGSPSAPRWCETASFELAPPGRGVREQRCADRKRTVAYSIRRVIYDGGLSSQCESAKETRRAKSGPWQELRAERQARKTCAQPAGGRRGGRARARRAAGGGRPPAARARPLVRSGGAPAVSLTRGWRHWLAPPVTPISSASFPRRLCLRGVRALARAAPVFLSYGTYACGCLAATRLLAHTRR